MKEAKETATKPSYPAAAFMRLKSKEHATRRDMERLLDVLKVKSRDQCDVFVVNTYDSYAVCFIKAEVQIVRTSTSDTTGSSQPVSAPF